MLVQKTEACSSLSWVPGKGPIIGFVVLPKLCSSLSTSVSAILSLFTHVFHHGWLSHIVDICSCLQPRHVLLGIVMIFVGHTFVYMVTSTGGTVWQNDFQTHPPENFFLFFLFLFLAAFFLIFTSSAVSVAWPSAQGLR